MALAFAPKRKASRPQAKSPVAAPAKPNPKKSKEKPAVNTQATTTPNATEIMKLPVFGPADFFPMLAEDELEDLAEDIRANGLREPLVVGEIADEAGAKTLMLVDGRNRREACRRAGVVPSVRRLEDEDATAFVLSVNVNRRHMTAGQRAAARALLSPEAKIGRPGKGFVAKPFEDDVSKASLSKARLVLNFDAPLLRSVISGSMTLDAAYSQAKEAQAAEQQKETEQAVERGKLDGLRKRYPDLARRVEEDGLGLNSMLTEAADRDAAAKSQRQSLFMGLRNARTAMSGFANSSELPKLPDYLKSREIKREFVDAFRDEPASLVQMVDAMEAELAALKAIVSQIEEA